MKNHRMDSSVRPGKPDNPDIVFREVEIKDLPNLAGKFVDLNIHYQQMGYLLPTPPEVGKAWLDSFQRTLGRFTNVFIAEKNQEIVGFALCRLKRLPSYMCGLMVGELSDIWISPKVRRGGIGKTLVEMVIDWLQKNGAHSVEVQVLKDNGPAQAMFESFGFQLEFRSSRLVFQQQENPPEPHETD